MTTAVGKWPASARLWKVAPAGHLPTALTPRAGTRPYSDREFYLDAPGAFVDFVLEAMRPELADYGLIRL